jgi:fructokinase
MGTIGDDQYGRYILRDFESLGIETKHLIVASELNTVGVFAFIDEFGERYLWGWPRVDQAFKEIDMDKVRLEDVREAAWVHSSGMALVHDSSARESIIRILKEAYEAGVPTSFDLNLRVDQGALDESYKCAVLEAMKYCTYVLGSGDEEFYHLNPQDDWIESAKSFATAERIVIARMGKEGSMAITPEGAVKAEAFSVEVIDTVGAGDVYNAGFIAARIRGKSLQESLVMGNAVSGFAVNQKGARNTPNCSELEEFISKYKG